MLLTCWSVPSFLWMTKSSVFWYSVLTVSMSVLSSSLVLSLILSTSWLTFFSLRRAGWARSGRRRCYLQPLKMRCCLQMLSACSRFSKSPLRIHRTEPLDQQTEAYPRYSNLSQVALPLYSKRPPRATIGNLSTVIRMTSVVIKPLFTKRTKSRRILSGSSHRCSLPSLIIRAESLNLLTAFPLCIWKRVAPFRRIQSHSASKFDISRKRRLTRIGI